MYEDKYGNSVMSVKKAQEIILEFLRDNFDSEKISEVEDLINNCPVNIVDEQELNELSSTENEIYDKENIGAYASEEGIFLPKEFLSFNPNIEFDEDNKLITIIHEYAHKFRKIHSNYGNMFEEGFATIFATACIIYSRIKKQISEEQEITQPGVFVNTSWKYNKAESQVTAILYILNQKGLDIEMLGEYIFGEEDVFKQKCSEVFGEEFSKYFELANSISDQYYNDYDDKQNNSEVLLVNILKNYIRNNDINLKNYWDRNYIFLYNRGSKTLAKGVVAAGPNSIREEDKQEYKLFESTAKIANQDDQEEKVGRINRIRNFILDKYSLSGKNLTDMYGFLNDLCSEYIQKRNSNRKENLMFLEELKKVVPNIDSLTKKFVELKEFATSSSVFENLDINNISYSNIEKYISLSIEKYKQKQQIETIKTKFNDCNNKMDLLARVDELKDYIGEIDINQILPNYNYFIKFIEELEPQIPDDFDQNKKWNYEKIYKELLNSYISKKEQELAQAKQLEKDYTQSIDTINTQYSVVSNENVFNNVKNNNDTLNNKLSLEQQELEALNQSLSKNQSELNNLLNEIRVLQNKNFIIRFFKRKKISELSAKIHNLEIKIQNEDTMINQSKNTISDIQSQIKQNENQLIDLCGLNLEAYDSLLMICKLEKLTRDKLSVEQSKIEMTIEKLNISLKEKELANLYEQKELLKQKESPDLYEMLDFEEQHEEIEENKVINNNK